MYISVPREAPTLFQLGETVCLSLLCYYLVSFEVWSVSSRSPSSTAMQRTPRNVNISWSCLLTITNMLRHDHRRFDVAQACESDGIDPLGKPSETAFPWLLGTLFNKNKSCLIHCGLRCPSSAIEQLFKNVQGFRVLVWRVSLDLSCALFFIHE